jgi:hypothetical protein
MAEDKSAKPKDEDLLANAIPIEGMDEEEPAPAAAPVEDGPVAIEMAEEDANAPVREIKTFAAAKRQEDKWSRTPNATGQGAVHVRSFVAKLRMDAIENLDRQVNEWLEQHPQYEVKFVTASIGELSGKITEPAMFLTVWV